MTYNDLGRWANMRFEFIKQHRPQLYQSLLKENKLHSYLVEFDRQVQDTLILTEEQMRQAEVPNSMLSTAVKMTVYKGFWTLQMLKLCSWKALLAN